MSTGSGPVRPQATLYVEPSKIGHAAAAFRDAARDVDQMIWEAKRNLVVEPAMGDLASIEFAQYATECQVTGDGSIVQMFEMYRDELVKIAEQLDASRLAYERADAGAAESIG